MTIEDYPSSTHQLAPVYWHVFKQCKTFTNSHTHTSQFIQRHTHSDTTLTETTEEGTDVKDERREGGRDNGMGGGRVSVLTGL